MPDQNRIKYLFHITKWQSAIACWM